MEIDMQQRIPKCAPTTYAPETIWKSKIHSFAQINGNSFI